MTIAEALERDLPPATLLLGPDLEMLLHNAYRVQVRHGVSRADALLRRHVSAADARGIVNFARTAPFGPFKLVIAALDGSTAQAQNILLKVLEEPPDSVRFILAATTRPLPAIVSRCQVITVPAEGPAPEADGKVAAQVAAALKAAAAGDLAGLDKALAGWSEAHQAVLCAWLTAAAAGLEPHGLNQVQARRLLGVLGRFSSAHPRLAAHAALTSIVLSDREHHD